MRLYRIQVDIYEAATRYHFPVVTHQFHGASPHEARRYHESHRKADRFIRECVDSGRFERTVTCRAVITEGWIEA